MQITYWSLPASSWNQKKHVHFWDSYQLIHLTFHLTIISTTGILNFLIPGFTSNYLNQPSLFFPNDLSPRLCTKNTKEALHQQELLGLWTPHDHRCHGKIVRSLPHDTNPSEVGIMQNVMFPWSLCSDLFRVLFGFHSILFYYILF